MLAHGDEIGRTQRGNNNVYCQDSEISWMDWSLCDKNADQLSFTRKVIEFRKRHPVFRRRRFFEGKPIRSRRPVPRHRVAHPGRQRNDAGGLGIGSGQVRCGLPQRRSHRRAQRARRARGRRLVPALLQRTQQEGGFRRTRQRAMPPSGPQRSTPPTRRARPISSSPRARSSRLHHGPYWCCVRPPNACHSIRFRRIDYRCAVTPSHSPTPRTCSTTSTNSASPTCTCRRSSPRRRARRTATTSPIPPRCRPNWAAPTAWPGCRRRRAEARIGLIVDIVPNHVGVDDPQQNPWWLDVLTHGRNSAYSSYFDIDWDLDPDGKIVLPILGARR